MVDIHYFILQCESKIDSGETMARVGKQAKQILAERFFFFSEMKGVNCVN